jgi:hypothetical protein
MKAIGSQIRQRAVVRILDQPEFSLEFGGTSLLKETLWLSNSPNMVICLVGKGGVCFRKPFCCTPDMAWFAVRLLLNKKRGLGYCSGGWSLQLAEIVFVC